MIQKDSKIGRTITGRSATIDFPIHIGEPQRRPIVEKDYPYYLDFHDRMVRLAHDCVKAGLKVFVPNVEERLHRRPTETWFTCRTATQFSTSERRIASPRSSP